VVLVVDDDRHVRNRIVQVLSEAGAVVGAAADTETALRVAGTARFGIDVVVTDLSVPELGGAALAERLRSRHRSLVVVVASGLSDAAAECERVGATFVPKPFGADDLVAAVRRALGPAWGPTPG
jgi:DNA-binding NtrC family response regulator